MNKTDFINIIAQKTNLSKSNASAALEAVLSTIVETVAAGDSIRMPGFGTFEISNRSATKGRNPSTGAEIAIPARKVPKFSAGKTFKELVNK